MIKRNKSSGISLPPRPFLREDKSNEDLKTLRIFNSYIKTCIGDIPVSVKISKKV